MGGGPRGENKETTEMILSPWRQDKAFPFDPRSEPPAENTGRQQDHVTQSLPLAFPIYGHVVQPGGNSLLTQGVFSVGIAWSSRKAPWFIRH
jgi:hypothetical protein